jgi:hypothetical protein
LTLSGAAGAGSAAIAPPDRHKASAELASNRQLQDPNPLLAYMDIPL